MITVKVRIEYISEHITFDYCDSMSSNPLDIYKKVDVKIIEQNRKLMRLSFSEGVLSLKFKLLIARAIDVENGALEGVIALGKRV